jgi:ubiquinone/menaquinone biosynthesis C-methylase UbiE
MPNSKKRAAKSFLEAQGLSAVEAREKAQFIAFAPVLFKVALALRNQGVLVAVEAAGEEGLTFDELAGKVTLSGYGLRVLVDGGLQAGLFAAQGERIVLTSTGYFVLNDPMTRVNLNFVNDVWYRGLDHLEASVVNGKPEGLKELGTWPTIYRALAELPQGIRKSWLEFDHFYSDDAFPLVLPILFRDKPKRLVDIGGNTGKFALECTRHDADVQVTIVDLPGQCELARKNMAGDPRADRVSFHPADMLDPDVRLPEGADVIWMSQFLDCFSEQEIVNILTACRRVMGPATKVLILEPLTDRQRFQGSTFVLQMTSLYFTNMANGNSRMYTCEEMTRLADQAGLKVREVVSNLGICQSLMVLELP